MTLRESAWEYLGRRHDDGALPKAVVMLIAGGTLNAGLAAGDASTGFISSTGGNFLVRSAQLYANAGYLAVVMDRPTDVADHNAEVDPYRVSVDHAVDILSVLRQVNTDNLPLILAGTSRGALSAVANNLIASAVEISSAVTLGVDPYLYVGKPGIANLQPSFVQRPSRVLWHQGDLCPDTSPANSQSLFDALEARLSGLGISASSYSATGGARVATASASATPDVCGAVDYHGFMGIEPTVVAAETTYFDSLIAAQSPNRNPKAAFATVQTTVDAPIQIDLSTMTSDADNDTLGYALSHDTTSLGGGEFEA